MAESMKKVDPYNLAPTFEHELAYLLCTSPRMYGRIGHVLEPDALAAAPVRLVVRIVQELGKELGRGPSSPSLVLQRIARHQHEGKATQEELDAVFDLLELVPPRLPTEEELVAELVPLLRRREEQRGLREALEAHTQRGNLTEAMQRIQRASALGKMDASLGTRLGPETFDLINRLRAIDKLSLGVPELDIALNGGLPRGCLGSVVMPTGTGKSQSLVHFSATSVNVGAFALYATTELAEARVMARIQGNLTRFPVNAILEGNCEECKVRLATMAPQLGIFIARKFDAGLTTFDDVREWVARCEEAEHRQIDLLVVDYADDLKASHVDKKEDHSYTTMKKVYESMRLFAENRGVWCWTASQAKGRPKSDRKKRIESEDLADSQHKGRVADVILSGLLSEDQQQIEWYVAKNRNDRSGFSVGPLPVDFSMARLCP